jgi:[NiFe] hydrogenase large subunit/hydrogenase large subunit
MATEQIVVDPLTRIEGHLRIETQVEDGKVTDAWSSATMWRGIELILKDRDPRDAWYFTQRICGVCTTVHALASVRAVENALGIEVPLNAVLMRNLIEAAQYIQDHVIHFYHLHALDWVDVVSALEADPEKASKLATTTSDWPNNGVQHFTSVQNRLKAFVDSGQLGIFANGYWGHPAQKLPPEANLMAVAHYLEALEWQRDFIRIHAVLGSKNPHLQTYVVGGSTLAVDPNGQSVLNAERIALLQQLFKKGLTFVEQVYIPDLLAVASFYKDWAAIGGGHGNFLTYGDFPLGTGDPSTTPDIFYQPRGIILDKDLSIVHPVEHAEVTEYVTHSWFDYQGGNGNGLHPWEGQTNPNYTGPRPASGEAYETLITSDEAKYSWLKAPRYNDKPMEVGPLARMLVAYASKDAPNHESVKTKVDTVLKRLDVGPEALFSTLGRTAARGIETWAIAEVAQEWLSMLTDNIGRGDLSVHNGTKWDPKTWPRLAQGVGMTDAPRGALGHWVHIEDQHIRNYQCVVPTTWNAGPRDAHGQRGPYEEALIDTPIADPERPLEILRTIHSFDPCMACAAHVVDTTGQEIVSVKVR